MQQQQPQTQSFQESSPPEPKSPVPISPHPGSSHSPPIPVPVSSGNSESPGNFGKPVYPGNPTHSLSTSTENDIVTPIQKSYLPSVSRLESGYQPVPISRTAASNTFYSDYDIQRVHSVATRDTERRESTGSSPKTIAITYPGGSTVNTPRRRREVSFATRQEMYDLDHEYSFPSRATVPQYSTAGAALFGGNDVECQSYVRWLFCCWVVIGMLVTTNLVTCLFAFGLKKCHKFNG